VVYFGKGNFDLDKMSPYGRTATQMEC